MPASFDMGGEAATRLRDASTWSSRWRKLRRPLHHDQVRSFLSDLLRTAWMTDWGVPVRGVGPDQRSDLPGHLRRAEKTDLDQSEAVIAPVTAPSEEWIGSIWLPRRSRRALPPYIFP